MPTNLVTKSWLARAGWLTLAVATTFLLWLTVIGYRSLFNSDDAAFMVAAQLAQSEGSLLPSSWIFVNGDFWIQLTLLYRLLAMAAPLGWWAHAIVHLLLNSYLAIALWLTARTFGPRDKTLVLKIAIVGACFTYPLLLNVWGASFYGTVLANLLFLALITLQIVRPSPETVGSKKLWAYLGFVLLGSLSFATSPTRALAFYFVPIALTLLALKIRGLIVFSRDRVVRLASLTALSGVLGLLGYVALASQTNLGKAPALRLRSLDAPAVGLQNAAETILISFGLLPGKDYVFGQVDSSFAWLGAIELALIVVVAIGWWNTRSARGHSSKEASYFRRLALISVGLVYTILIFTDSIVPTVRYVTPGLVLFVSVILWSALDDWSRLASWVRSCTATLLIIVLLQTTVSIGELVQRGNGRNPHDSLAKLLVDEGLENGFAPYWDASVTSILSDSQISVAPVDIFDDSVPVPALWAANTDAFKASGEEQFLVWPKSKTWVPDKKGDVPKPNFAGSKWLGIKPTRTLENKRFKVFVFKSGDLQTLQDWSDSLKLIEKSESPKG